MKTVFILAGLVLLLTGVSAAGKLDEGVLKDFQAGFTGDQQALDRAMKAAEAALAEDPKHAEALVWHGAATFFLCGQAYQSGDMVKGQELWDKGLKEMADAVALEQDGIGVRQVRWQVLTGATQHPMLPPDMAAQLLEVALPDGEKILSVHGESFGKQPPEYRGGLLMGLARGWDQLGKEDKARPYFERIVKDLPGSEFEKKAKEWLDAREKKE
jgi:tetratricopeptide (TPR) repeat protein